MSKPSSHRTFSVFGNRFYFTSKFALPIILLVIIFTNLGIWQLTRAHQKAVQQKLYTQRVNLAPLDQSALDIANKDYRYYSIALNGYFDNDHQFLVDNRFYNGQRGYDVITPFKSNSTTKAILVDRGWVPMGATRETLPMLDPITTPVTIDGLMIPQPNYFCIGSLYDANNIQWPLVTQHININIDAGLLNYELYPYILILNPHSPYGFQRIWNAESLSANTHYQYARNWFWSAGFLFILFFIFGFRRTRK